MEKFKNKERGSKKIKKGKRKEIIVEIKKLVNKALKDNDKILAK